MGFAYNKTVKYKVKGKSEVAFGSVDDSQNHYYSDYEPEQLSVYIRCGTFLEYLQSQVLYKVDM